MAGEPDLPPLPWMVGPSSVPFAGDPWGPDAASSALTYWHWRELRRQAAAQRGRPRSSGRAPTLSVVTPVAPPVSAHLRQTVRSLISQTSPNWELVLCETESVHDLVTEAVAGLVESEPRVKVILADGAGEVSMLNRALAAAAGSFLLVLDDGDVLEPSAVAEMASVLTAGDDIDVLYSDEDRFIDIERPVQPHFKPDWDPDLLLSTAYLGHGLVIRTDVVRSVGGYRDEWAGAHDHDLMLRATEAARQVAHLPLVLYHRRIEDPVLRPSPDEHQADEIGRLVLESALERRGIDGRVQPGPFPGAHHVRRPIGGAPTVSVIIPFRDQAALTVACLDSLEQAPGWPIAETVLIDNGSTEPETKALRRRLAGRHATRVLDYPEPFNWSAINNMAAAGSHSDMLLFMNNDIEATSPDWLGALVEQAQRPEVGAVAPRLVYPDGHVQHAGVVLGLGGIAMHLFSRLPPGRAGYFGWDRVVRGYSALTGACLLVRRPVFEEVGGFDEDLPVAFNDVDFCLRLAQAGYRMLYTPHAELTHYESVSRGHSGFTTDFATFVSRWWDVLGRDDPAYNPNLGRFAPWCPLRMPGEDERWLAEVGAAVPDQATGPARL